MAIQGNLARPAGHLSYSQQAASSVLSRRLARGSTAILSSVVTANGKSADASCKECKGVVLAVVIIVIEVVRRSRSSRRRAIRSGLESSLSSSAIKGPSRVGTGSRSETLVVHRAGIATGTAANAGRQKVARGSSKMLVIATARSKGVARVEGARARARSAGHGSLAHAVLRGVIHRGRITRISNNCRSSPASTAAETAHILGEIVVATNLIATLPVTGTERNDTTTTHATTAVAHGAVVTTMWWRRHHGRRSITTAAIAIATSWFSSTGAAAASSRERASETSSSALEVREAARRAGPVARPGAVLAGRERSKNVLSAVKHTAGGGRNLDGLFVQGTSVHAQALGSLDVELAKLNEDFPSGLDVHHAPTKVNSK